MSEKKGKSKRGKKKLRTKKGKKSKTLKKMRKAKRRGRNRKGKRQKQNARQENSNCKNLTCLNDILQVLKVDKDTVQNFIQQNRRLKSRLQLAGLWHSFNLFSSSSFHLYPCYPRNSIQILLVFIQFVGFHFIFHLDLYLICFATHWWFYHWWFQEARGIRVET